jgi:hypothetical protein
VIIDKLKSNLKEVCDEVVEMHIESYGRHYWYLTGHIWCTDCGFPMELIPCFDGIEINATYCNNNEYGIIDKNHIYTSVNDSSQKR